MKLSKCRARDNNNILFGRTAPTGKRGKSILLRPRYFFPTDNQMTLLPEKAESEHGMSAELILSPFFSCEHDKTKTHQKKQTQEREGSNAPHNMESMNLFLLGSTVF